MQFIQDQTEQKLRGGYYTPEKLANYLTQWVISAKPKKILEPSCGDGAFLKAISNSISRAQLSHQLQVDAFEINAAEAVKAMAVAKSSKITNLQYNVLNTDFLQFVTENVLYLPEYDGVVGNPPFIRYQYLPEVSQHYSEQIFNHLNLKFTKHTNLWVPFLAASIAMLRPGGRLAMVIPSELFHVIHANSVRAYLLKNCSRIHIIDPQEIVFEKTLQGTIVLACQKNETSAAKGKGISISSPKSLNDMKQSINGYFFKPNYTMPNSKSGKWLHAFLSPEELVVYEKIISHPSVYNFETIAQVDVGIVTGANSFFLVDDETVKKYKLKKWAKPMFGRSELVRGVIYDQSEHEQNTQTGLPTNFLHFNVQSIDELSPSAQEYIKLGEKLSLHHRYKCRIRDPWFKVPSVSSTSLGMLKRAHDIPRLVFNKIEAFTTDTAYRIKVKKYTPEILAFSFVNSFTALTAELEGRHYGGGVLELVPSEIENLAIPVPEEATFNLNQLHQLFLKKIPITEILKKQDRIILGGLGLTGEEQEIIHGAWLKMRNRRQRK